MTVSISAPGTLAVERGGEWRTWWQSERAPERWTGEDTAVTNAIEWRGREKGFEWGSVRLSGPGTAWRLRAIVVKIDPRIIALRVVGDTTRRGAPYLWDIGDENSELPLVVNAGQFDVSGPFGWSVRNGVERQSPRAGPLAPAVVIDETGTVSIVSGDSIAAVRARGRIAYAFQTYPQILQNGGIVPAALRADNMGIDREHRDARLALGIARNGTVIMMLTRFEGLGGALDHLPFGLTTPETAALMGALGAETAVMLDGGISSQMRVNAGGRRGEWKGMRFVPEGLVGERR